MSLDNDWIENVLNISYSYMEDRRIEIETKKRVYGFIYYLSKMIEDEGFSSNSQGSMFERNQESNTRRYISHSVQEQLSMDYTMLSFFLQEYDHFVGKQTM